MGSVHTEKWFPLFFHCFYPNWRIQGINTYLLSFLLQKTHVPISFKMHGPLWKRLQMSGRVCIPFFYTLLFLV